MNTKTCTKCNKIKNLCEFRLRKDSNTYRGICLICEKEYSKNYHEKTKHHKNTLAKIWYEKNKKTRAVKIKEWKDNNPLKVSEINKRSKHKNRDKARITEKLWRKNNQDKVKAMTKNIRQKRRSACENTDVDSQYILKLFELQTNKCVYCKIKLNKNGKNKYHIDHIIPLSKGGKHTKTNIQLLCPLCNLNKNAKLPEIFAAEKGMLI